MRALSRWIGAAVLGAVVAGPRVIAQPSQFKANVRMKDGSDGSTSTGVVYVGSAKTRTELSKDGRDLIILSDPAARTQFVIMSSDKMYMQMPIGQGPVNVSVAGPTDPTNPCSGSGNTDCVKGPTETINGYETVRWDYTTQEGVRTRSWVSTTLRFPIKTSDDNGSSMEFSNIAVGPQPANLFAIPAGYTKMDVGAMGGMGRANTGRGRGTAGQAGARGNPMAEMMANLPPEAQAAMAAAMRGQTPNAAGGGSAWEKGKGWILSVVITGTATSSGRNDISTIRQTYSAKYVASIPLNYGTPGVPGVGAQGPTWSHMAGLPGSPEVLAKPLTVSVEAESRLEQQYPGGCPTDEPHTVVLTMKNTAQQSASIAQLNTGRFMAQSVFKISPDLKTYDLMATFGLESKEEWRTRTDGKSCQTGQAYTKNETNTRETEYAAAVDLKGLPLPGAVGTVTGTKKMPMTLGGKQVDATIDWTLAPVP
jgi:hypothetical protein